MRDDLGGLRRSVESSVERPAFDELAQRAEAIGRRRRTRRAALASSLAVAAIVFAAVLVTAPGGTDEEYAGRPGGAPRAVGQPNVAGQPTPVVRMEGSEVIRVKVGKRLLDDSGRKTATVELSGEVVEGQGRVTYFTFAERKAPGVWESSHLAEAGEPQCRGFELRQTRANTTFALPRRCLPSRELSSVWTALVPGADTASVEFVVSSLDDPYTEGVRELEPGDRVLEPPDSGD